MYKENNKQIFETVYSEFAKGIFRFVYFKVSDADLAEDLTADTFLRFWKVLQKEEKIENSKALLYLIAKGLVIDYYRKKKQKKQVSIDAIDERLLGTYDDTETRLAIKQEVMNIFIKMKELKKEYQDILLLYYIEDMGISEIAFILKKKENTTRVLLHRSLKALKGKL